MCWRRCVCLLWLLLAPNRRGTMDQRGSVSARVRRLSRHVRGSGAASCDGAGVVKAPTLAEAGHSGRVSKARLSRPEKAFYRSMLRFRYARTPLKVVYKEEGGGGGGEDTCTWCGWLLGGCLHGVIFWTGCCRRWFGWCGSSGRRNHGTVFHVDCRWQDGGCVHAPVRSDEPPAAAHDSRSSWRPRRHMRIAVRISMPTAVVKRASRRVTQRLLACVRAALATGGAGTRTTMHRSSWRRWSVIWVP